MKKIINITTVTIFFISIFFNCQEDKCREIEDINVSLGNLDLKIPKEWQIIQFKVNEETSFSQNKGGNSVHTEFATGLGGPSTIYAENQKWYFLHYEGKKIITIKEFNNTKFKREFPNKFYSEGLPFSFSFNLEGVKSPCDKPSLETYQRLKKDPTNMDFYKSITFYDSQTNFVYKLTNTLSQIIPLKFNDEERKITGELEINEKVMNNAFYGTKNNSK